MVSEPAAVVKIESPSPHIPTFCVTILFYEEIKSNRGTSYVAYQAAEVWTSKIERPSIPAPTFHITTLEKDTDRDLCHPRTLQHHAPRCPCRGLSPRQCSRVSWRRGGEREASCQMGQQAWTMRRDPWWGKMRLRLRCGGASDEAGASASEAPRNFADDLRAKTTSCDVVLAFYEK